MSIDALQNIDEIIVRANFVQAAGGQQALDDGDVFGTELGPGKQPVAPSQGITLKARSR